ncbi:MAG TPA: thioredoxin family protein [Vicinamibacteria bacterium]|jgi:thioredoxin-like negative regulator of GroEL
MRGTLALAFIWAFQPPPGGPGASPREAIRWERNFDEALKKAKAARKPLLVDFWAEWCGWCRRLDRTTYIDPQVVRITGDHFIAVKVNTEGSAKEIDVAVRYDVSTLPTIAFLSPAGRPLARLNGFQGPSQFPRSLEAAREVAARVGGWEQMLERDRDDVAALQGLGVHLFEQDAYRESAELLERAAKLDEGRALDERKQTRLLLGAILKSDQKYSAAEKVLRAGLALPASSAYDPKLLYVLGKLYAAQGRVEEARTVLQQVITLHAESAIAQKARETLIALGR